MSHKELQKFIEKVDQLNQLVNSLKKIPERREQIINCSTHEEVVAMAKGWGYEIGRRWGDPF